MPPPATTPILDLAGFLRLTLAVGETREVHFTLPPRAVAVVRGDSRQWWLFEAAVDIFVGETSPAPGDWERAATLQLTGNATLLDDCGPFE